MKTKNQPKMKNFTLTSCKIFLTINIIFWSIIAIYCSFFKFAANENYLIIKMLLFLEPLFFTIALIGLIKKIKIIYWLSIIFVLFNTVLSITDEIGIYDLVSLILNILILVNLLLVRKQIFPRQTITLNTDYSAKYLNKIITIKIDRPLGSEHPKYQQLRYPVNYGFIPNTTAPDGEEIDVYLLGVFTPVNEFSGRCIAIIHRLNDNDDKLIIVPENVNYTDDQIIEFTKFQEKYYKSEIIRK